MAVSDIDIADFKTYFVRDFPYYAGAGCGRDFVTDADIQKALDTAAINFNEGLFSDDAQLKIAFLYLTAHQLVTDLQIAAQGVQSVGYAPVTSRTVGAVSEAYQVPEWVGKDPIWGQYFTTRYGQQYAAIIRPLCIGNVLNVAGATTA